MYLRGSIVTAMRAVMVKVPRIFRDLIRLTVATRLQIDIVAESDCGPGWMPELRIIRPDLVFLGLPRATDERIIRQILTLLPAAKVVVLANDGTCMNGYDLQVFRTSLSEASPEAISNYLKESIPNDATIQ